MKRESITALMAKQDDIIEVRQNGVTTVCRVLGATLAGTKVHMLVTKAPAGASFLTLGASDGIVRRSGTQQETTTCPAGDYDMSNRNLRPATPTELQKYAELRDEYDHRMVHAQRFGYEQFQELADAFDDECERLGFAFRLEGTQLTVLVREEPKTT